MDRIKEVVQQRYAEAARRATSGLPRGCGCDTSTVCCAPDPVTSSLYNEEQTAAVPPEALFASLGCGNPTALADIKPGDTVLDLGSGGGIDVLLSARRVGRGGKAFGLDMTDEMLALARDNAQRSGLTNVEFLKGEIENIPLPDNSVDVIISNCVINLSADKDRVLAEAFRVLKPGGRFAVSDVVVRGDDLPAAVRADITMWVACVAGALNERSYRSKLVSAGFEAIDVEPINVNEDDQLMSAFIRARKPAAATRVCCDTTCCDPVAER